MSLRPAQTKEESKWQYCNYGYDTTKFKSFDDCMANHDKVFGIKSDTTKTDWAKIGKDLLNYGTLDYFSNVTSTPVLCKDGTYDYESNSPNARIDNSKTCINKGGRAENQQVVNATSPALPTKSGVSIFTKLAGAYNKNLIIAGVLVAGYFAYKKFKKM